MKIYVASSWRNQYQSRVVELLRENGHEVYDFKQPDGPGSNWETVGKEIGNEDWKNWTVEQYIRAIYHPVAVAGYRKDFEALSKTDACVFVAPAGVSAALEFGWACGAKRNSILYLPEPLREPDLMFKMANFIVLSEASLLNAITTISEVPLSVAATPPEEPDKCKLCGYNAYEHISRSMRNLGCRSFKTVQAAKNFVRNPHL